MNMTRCGCILTTVPKGKKQWRPADTKNINGSTYGFDEYGIMLPWWTKVASVSNADKSNPTSDVPAKFFAGYDGGSLLRTHGFGCIHRTI